MEVRGIAGEHDDGAGRVRLGLLVVKPAPEPPVEDA